MTTPSLNDLTRLGKLCKRDPIEHDGKTWLLVSNIEGTKIIGREPWNPFADRNQAGECLAALTEDDKLEVTDILQQALAKEHNVSGLMLDFLVLTAEPALICRAILTLEGI